ncbi:hypothetical protein ACFFHM_01760 [Halalkalibacter kiskunsagensis]|uniref:DUF3995 domain-containing protein n=1 Tax=Halalkalibacter kiskunsagensis TaxID=1548599 RepID=A0ABV6K893_9BACI
MEPKININNSTHFSWLSCWPQWTGYAAALWSLLYGLLGLYWFLGGNGFPFGKNDSRAEMMGSFLSNLNVDVGGPVIAIAGLVGTVVAIAMKMTWGSRFHRAIFLSYAWIMSVTLIFIVPDSRIVQNFAYLFLLHFDLLDWRVINQVFCIVGGFIWGASAIAYFRLTQNACGNCGRNDATEGSSAKATAKWGKWFTYFAVIMALPYGIVRWAWALGIPLGTNDSSMVGNEDNVRVEAILGGLCIGGGVLTLGLIQRWGVIFPWWCFFLAGKQIPIWFVMVPAMLMSTIITITGLKLSPQIIFMMVNGSITNENWGQFVPFLFWLPWGISLGIAILAYYLKRRGRCKHCGKL